MYKRHIILSALCLSLVFGQYDYSLEDFNSTSNFGGLSLLITFMFTSGFYHIG